MTLDVVIAGAGPTGLCLRASSAWPNTDDRRLLELFGSGRRAPPFAIFAMLQLDLEAIPFGHPDGLVAPQADVEQALEARAQELGVEIRRAHRSPICTRMGVSQP